jgi:hypothetical protein
MKKKNFCQTWKEFLNVFGLFFRFFVIFFFKFIKKILDTFSVFFSKSLEEFFNNFGDFLIIFDKIKMTLFPQIKINFEKI